MPYQVNTDSPIYKSLSPDQQKQVQDMAASGNIPPSVDQLYSTLNQTKAQTAQTQAAIPGTQANSQKAQIEAQQAAALKNLSSDLKQNKMTLPDAISKYKGLGMNPDDVFNQYLAQSPYGTPNQSPQELQRMGVTAKALGDIGTPGSFMDRWNTKNALQELRGLHDTWNNTSTMAHLPFLGDKDASARAYNAQKQVVGEHLSSLVPGASNSQGSNKGFLDSLPEVGDIFAPGAAQGQFGKIEQALLQQKGYSYKDVGLIPPQQPQQTAGNVQTQNAPQAPLKGGDLLNNGLNDILNMGKGAASTGSDVVRNQLFGQLADADPTGIIRAKLAQVGILPSESNAQIGLKTAGGIGNEYLHALGIVDNNGQLAKSGGDILNNAKDHFTNHPVNTVADALPFLTATKAAMAGNAAGAAEAGAGAVDTTTAAAATPKFPGAVKTALNPASSRDAGFAAKDAAIKTIDSQPNGGINSTDITSYINSKVPQLKKAFPNVDPAEIDQWAKNVETQWGTGKIPAKDAAENYDLTPSDKTKTGLQKERLSDHQNGILRDAISNAIEKAAPGAGWKEGVQAQAKAFAAEKGLPNKIIKSLPQNAVKAGLNAASFGILGDILGL